MYPDGAKRHVEGPSLIAPQQLHLGLISFISCFSICSASANRSPYASAETNLGRPSTAARQAPGHHDNPQIVFPKLRGSQPQKKPPSDEAERLRDVRSSACYGQLLDPHMLKLSFGRIDSGPVCF